ncbi:hypothetical protein BEP19_13335 [Ammoniphilus oxalaticus]|uniref:Mannosyl-glycoprotein endo-beta-N-acetylglucosamidase-like domain-containing protein n=1 Tax=Ammoniphilus oxalaticus TaxID=66863 RepID=A0A419SHC0_9BACL|nr:glucosaminidase domain-containing protein [Ammoniphilus oxalaticus]RKD23194.1 hypothetical protein BEP19_13335 [Ammoniphilus oxalaticus]
MLAKHAILGVAQATAQQMIDYTLRINPHFNPEIARTFLAVGMNYGVRGDIAFCQSIHETNWFRYGGDVRADQNNFSGLGATGGGARGASFPTIEAGVTAQIQHLYAYASTNPLPNIGALVDPRFHLVNRGSAPYWEDLGGKWAVPGYSKQKFASFAQAYAVGETYGQLIVALYERMLATTVAPQPPSQQPEFPETPAPTLPPQPDPVSPGPDLYPEGTPDWKKEAVDWMFEKGLLTNAEWKKGVDQPLPLWAEAVVLRRLMGK